MPDVLMDCNHLANAEYHGQPFCMECTGKAYQRAVRRKTIYTMAQIWEIWSDLDTYNLYVEVDPDFNRRYITGLYTAEQPGCFRVTYEDTLPEVRELVAAEYIRFEHSEQTTTWDAQKREEA